MISYQIIRMNPGNAGGYGTIVPNHDAFVAALGIKAPAWAALALTGQVGPWTPGWPFAPGTGPTAAQVLAGETAAQNVVNYDQTLMGQLQAAEVAAQAPGLLGVVVGFVDSRGNISISAR